MRRFAALRMRSYRPVSSHREIALGSVVGRLAFMGKPVLGRLRVSFQSGIVRAI